MCFHNTVHTNGHAVNFDGMIVNCTNGEARLIDGPSVSRGRLEVCLNQAWVTVCSSGFGIEESMVACGQLGFQRYGRIIMKFSFA